MTWEKPGLIYYVIELPAPEKDREDIFSKRNALDKTLLERRG